MKILRIFLFVIFFIFGKQISAASFFGGSLTYESKGNNKYLLRLQLYRDCQGQSLNTSDISFGTYSGSNGNKACGSDTLSGFTRVLIKDITYPQGYYTCGGTNTSVSGNGVELHVFERIIDLTKSPFSKYSGSSCRELVFYAMSNTRSYRILTGVGGSKLYITATLYLANAGTCKVKTNSSPQAKYHPVRIVCCNNSSCTNPGYNDADNDRLIYRLVPAIDGSTKQALTYNSPFEYQHPVTPYCQPPTSIKCTPSIHTFPERGFNFDSNTCDLIYYPTRCDEVSLITVEISELRKDSSGKEIIVGKSRMEYANLVYDIYGINMAPRLSFPTTSSVIAGDSICLFVTATDETFKPYQTIPDTVLLSWNNGIPKASLTILNPDAREKTGRFCWHTDSTDFRYFPYMAVLVANDQYKFGPQIVYKSMQIWVKKEMKLHDSISLIICNRALFNGHINSKLPASFTRTIYNISKNKIFWSGTRPTDTSRQHLQGNADCNFIRLLCRHQLCRLGGGKRQPLVRYHISSLRHLP